MTVPPALRFYVHVPYCSSRCGYCDFNTYVPGEAGRGAAGVRLVKLGMPWPLEADAVRAFATGLAEILVVEEKRQVIEYQLKEMLYDWRDSVRPHVLGKFDHSYPFYMNYHWRVFRANAATAQLTVSDWATPTDPGGPEGQEIVYNFLELQPYLQR